MAKLAVIDADSIVWAVAWNNRNEEDYDKIYLSTDAYVHSILSAVGATQYVGFLGRGKSFRVEAAKNRPYKGLRKPKPDWMVRLEPTITGHLIRRWNFHIVTEIEADDAVAIMATVHPKAIICSGDKDLKQLAGTHYDPQKKTTVTVTKEDAWKNLYIQMLAGDTTDNIEGVKGIGPVGAQKLISCLKSPEEAEYVVQREFFRVYGQEDGQRLLDETKLLVTLLRQRSTPEVWGTETYKP